MPTDGWCTDPSEAIYWEADALQKEITRAFEICHGCRMCFKYCDSFPTLFDLIDNKYDGDVRKISASETEEVMDHCFQCKLCEVQCPYTPRDNHEFQLDFPKIVHRFAAQRTRKHGVPMAKRILANPDLAGTMARASLGTANVMNRVKLHRIFMEKMLGVHRDKLLPDFASKTFESWASSNDKMTGPGAEAVLFQTCYVQNNEPEIGVDTMEVMDRNSISVTCQKGLECCGMPSWERGDLDTLRQRASHNLDLLEPHVDAGSKVIVINPTCAMMLRREYPELVAPEDKERATKVAEAVRDPAEYVWSIRKEERFNTDFASSPGQTVAYHAPCHLRAQAVGFRGRDLIKKTGARLGTVLECCGHDGTWAMTVDGFGPSQKVGKKSFDGMNEQQTEVWATDCPLAAIQFQQHAGRKPMHPMSILAKAYRGDSFGDDDAENNS